MKSINTFLFSLISFLFTTTAFSQDLSDREIGFDEGQAIIELRERGFMEPEEFRTEIQVMREMRASNYAAIKKIKDDIIQKIELEQNAKNIQSRTANTDVPSSEKEALLAFYNSTGGSGWNARWDFSTPVTSWNPSTRTGWVGITVSEGHVTSINLQNNNVTGSLPAEISQLQNLNILNLRLNKVTGTIPSQIGQLQNLQVFDLDGNLLSGTIPPEILQLHELQVLNLFNNRLSGVIPPEIGQLINLVYLDLASSSYGKNNLTGNILSGITSLTKLQILNLSFNTLGGIIPVEFCALTQLRRIFFQYTQLKGSIPIEFGQLSQLDQLDLSFNQLTGSIPSGIGYFSRLGVLYLNNNQFTGPIPIGVAPMPLTMLYLHNNSLTGSIPEGIEQLVQLRYIDLTNNRVTGTIPAGINNLTSLVQLYLSGNSLAGIIPDLSNLPVTCKIRVKTEKFRFADLAPQFISTNRDIWYSSQAEIDSSKAITAGIGGHLTMTMYEDNRYLPEETFQWYKNNQLIPGAVSRQLTIPNIVATDAGSYYCLAKHPTLTIGSVSNKNLVLKRANITLTTIPCRPIMGSITTRTGQPYAITEGNFSSETTMSSTTKK